MRDGMIPGEILLPGWEERGPYDTSRRMPTEWPAVRPPQVGERVELLGGGYGNARDVRTVTAVAWAVVPSGTRHASGLPSFTAGLVVEVGERVPC